MLIKFLVNLEFLFHLINQLISLFETSSCCMPRIIDTEENASCFERLYAATQNMVSLEPYYMCMFIYVPLVDHDVMTVLNRAYVSHYVFAR